MSSAKEDVVLYWPNRREVYKTCCLLKYSQNIFVLTYVIQYFTVFNSIQFNTGAVLCARYYAHLFSKIKTKQDDGDAFRWISGHVSLSKLEIYVEDDNRFQQEILRLYEHHE